MTKEKLRVGVIGAGRWARTAHLPGWARSPLCELAVLCDLDSDLAAEGAAQFEVPETTTDYEELLSRDDIDLVDVVTRGDHQDLVFAVLEAGKHCLVEKPVCHDYHDVWRAHELAATKGLKTKVGLTFRYAPAVMFLFDLIRDGFIGQPFIFNGFEQNSQWLDPDNPMDKRIHKTPGPRVKPALGRPILSSRKELPSHRWRDMGPPPSILVWNAWGVSLTQVVGILGQHGARTDGGPTWTRSGRGSTSTTPTCSWERLPTEPCFRCSPAT